MQPMTDESETSNFHPRLSLSAILPGLVLLGSVALILSFFMSWATVGFSAEFPTSWGRSFLTTLLVLPLALVCLGALEKQLDKVIGNWNWVIRKLILAAIAACLIETIVGFAVTAVGHSFDATFPGNWWLAFSRSLPAGVVISLFMTFYMKPRMDRMRKTAQNRVSP
jgi:hypothetical protein